MIQRWKNHAFALGDFAIGRIHVGDNSRVVFHDVAIAVDYSGCELTGHATS
jgi:hypothetical protein